MFLRTNPVIHYLMLMLTLRVERAKRSDRGASAVEWVVIAAIVVGICVGVGLLIRNALTDKGNQIVNDINRS